MIVGLIGLFRRWAGEIRAELDALHVDLEAMESEALRLFVSDATIQALDTARLAGRPMVEVKAALRCHLVLGEMQPAFLNELAQALPSPLIQRSARFGRPMEREALEAEIQRLAPAGRLPVTA